MTEATTTNPLNIRAGDTIEHTGKSWAANIKQEVVSVDQDGIYYKARNWSHLVPPEGYEHTVHYKHEDGDRYLCTSNDRIYTLRGGVPTFLLEGQEVTTQFANALTSEHYTRLAPESITPRLTVKIAPAGADLNDDGQWMDITEAVVAGGFSLTSEEEKADEPATKKQWVTVPGSEAEDGDRVRIPSSRAIEYKVEGEHIHIAPNVSVFASEFEELEVLREVIELPTAPGLYMSHSASIILELGEGGTWECNGAEGKSVAEYHAPLTRIITAKEADEKKQAAIAQQKEQYRSKRAQARSRFDAYQEELLNIIRRRNQEKIGLVEEIDRLRAENRSLRGEPDATW